MAYISQEMKKKISNRLKSNFPTWSFRIKIVNNSKVSVTIVRADVDFLNIANEYLKNNFQENGYQNSYRKKEEIQIYGDFPKYFGKNKEAVSKMMKVFEDVNLVGDSVDENYDNSDVMSDYFNVGYYTCINIGGCTPSTKFTYVQEHVDNNEFI